MVGLRPITSAVIYMEEKMNSINCSFTRLCTVMVIVSVTILSACDDSREIIGAWHKIPGEVCGEIYPEKVVFLDDSTYVGGLLSWNGGQYRVVSGKTIKLDTRSGPGLYEFSMVGDVLTFKTDWGCEFKYAKER
jgi:hypothetical protein